MNIRPRPPVGANQRLYEVHMPPTQAPPYLPPQFAMAPPGCILPQQDYYIRLPYYQYPQYPQYPSYLGYPGLGNDPYRMMAPQGILPPPMGLPYQGLPPTIPPGYGMIRQQPWPISQPIDYGLPGLQAQHINPTRPPFYDQSTTVPGRPRSNETAGQTQATATMLDATGQQTFQNSGQGNFTNKSRWKTEKSRSKSNRPQQHSLQNTSKTRRRNATSNRRRRLSAKKSLHRKNHDRECNNQRSLSSEPVDLSSILKEDDDNYETCEEEEIDENLKQNLTPSINLFSQKKSTSGLDFTLITNEKSFSHVNFKPKSSSIPHQRIPLQDKTQTTANAVGRSERRLSNGGIYYFMKPLESESCSAPDVNSNTIITNDKPSINNRNTVSFRIQNNSTGFWDESVQDENNNRQQSFLNISLNDNADQNTSANRSRLSAFSNISKGANENNNNNELRVSQPGLWWDKSTDVGYKSIQKSPVVSVKSDISLKELSSSSNSPYIQEIEGFVVVDAAFKQNGKSKKVNTKSDVTTEDPNNNQMILKEDEDLNQQTQVSCSTSSNSVVLSQVCTGLKKLDVNWTEIRKVVPQEYLRRSYTNAGSVQYDLGSSSRQGSLLQTSGSLSFSSDIDLSPKCPSKLQSNKQSDDKISDQDDAIVAAIKEVDCLNLNASLEQEYFTSQSKKYLPNNDSLLQSSLHPMENSNLVEIPSTPTSKSYQSWGKQDVRMLLIATTTTTMLTSSNSWCPVNSSTPSVASVSNSSALDQEKNYQQPIPINKLMSRLKPLHHKEKLVKSLPSTPIRSTEKIKNLKKPLMRHSSMLNLASFTTVGGSFSSVDVDIDCKKFNDKGETNLTPHSKVFKDIPFTAKRSEKIKPADSTYLLTPASSQLEFVSHIAKIEADKKSLQQPKLIKKPALTTLSSNKSNVVSSIKSSKHNQNAAKSPSIQDASKDINKHRDVKSKGQPSKSYAKNKLSSKPCRLPVPARRVKQKCHGRGTKSSSVSPASSVKTLTPVTTPETLETNPTLGPNGSKTITKTKRRLSSSTRNNNARRSLTSVKVLAVNKENSDKILNTMKPLVVDSSKLNSNKNENTQPRARLRKSSTSTSKFVKNNSKLSTSTAQSSSLTTTSKSSVVSTKPPSRRSPRTMRSTLSAVQLPEIIDTVTNGLSSQKSKSCSRLMSVFEDQTSENIKKSDDDEASLKQTETLNRVESATKDQPPCDDSCIISTIQGAPTPMSSPAIASDCVKMETHGNVQSAIKSIVHSLSNQSQYQKRDECSSPSFLAIRDQYVKKFINLQKYDKSVEFSTIQTSMTRTVIRSNSLPNSPTRQPSFSSFQRSASLSDVFYDTASESSYIGSIWDSNRAGGHAAIHKQNVFQKWNKRKNALQPCTEATYIAYTPPTITPPKAYLPNLPVPTKALLNPIRFKMTDSELSLEQSNYSVPLKTKDRNDGKDVLKETGRVRILSQELENEIRRKAELLVDSVNDNGKLVGNKTNIVKFEQTSKRNIPGGNKLSFKSKSLQTLVKVSEPKRLPATKSMEKLNVPPKKPPRSNSPNLLKKDNVPTVSSVNETPNTLHPNARLIQSTNSSTAGLHHYSGSPVIPYYPLITAYPGISPHRHPHFLSPTLIPYTYGQQFNRNAFPGFVWPLQQQPIGTMDQYNSDISISHNSDKSDNSADRSQPSQLASPAFSQAAFLAQPHLAVPIQDHIRLQNSMAGLSADTRERFSQNPANSGSYYLQQQPKYPSAPRPKGTPTRKLALRRRRSFSAGLSSSAVAKTRLNRRVHANIKYLTASRGMKTSHIFNSSHPLPKRRPRFVRSSLTEDSVFQTMQPKSKNPKFFTKPTVTHRETKIAKDTPETSQTKQTAENVPINKRDIALTTNGTETGYHSSTTSSRPCSPEESTESDNKENVNERNTQQVREKKLTVIPEDRVQSDVISSHKSDDTVETVQQANVPDPDTAEDISEISLTKVDDKKRRRYPTIKKFKNFLTNKKNVKHLASQSQTDFRANEQATSSTLKRSSTDSKLPPTYDPLILTDRKNDQPKENFIWGKHLAYQSHDSTLKADISGVKSYRVQNVNHGYRPTYDMKMAMLKPSFVAIAPSEVRVADDFVLPEDYNDNRHGNDNLTDTIQPTRNTNRRSVATTPGVRINSETGDFLEEEKGSGPGNDKKSFKFLSSTVIDDDVMHAPLHTNVRVMEALAELEEATLAEVPGTVDQHTKSKPKSKRRSLPYPLGRNRNDRKMSTEI